MAPDTKEADHNTAVDPENPEWTAEDFADAVPFKDAHPDLYTAWKRDQHLSTVNGPKVQLALQLSPDVVRAIQAIGKDYNDRIEAVLTDAIARGVL